MKTIQQHLALAAAGAAVMLVMGCSGTTMEDYLSARDLLERGAVFLGMGSPTAPPAPTPPPGPEIRYGVLTGKVKDTSKRDVNGATVAVYLASTGALVQYGTTNAAGVFTFENLPSGDLIYIIEVAAEGYLSATKNNVSVIADDRLDVGLIYVVPANAQPGVITGMIVDANDGRPLPDSTVQVLDWTGSVVEGTQPSTEAFSTAQLSPGTYTLLVSRSGYFDFIMDNVTVNGNASVSRVAICEILSEPQVRVIVQWSKTPADLDLHVVGPTAKTATDGLPAERFHVYWSNQKSYNENDGKYSAAADPRGTASTTSLVQDSRTSWGPESINIFGFGSGYALGTYTFTVHQYSNDGTWYDGPVTMRVFDARGLVYELPVPTGAGTLRYWKALKLDLRGLASEDRSIIVENSFATLDYRSKTSMDW